MDKIKFGTDGWRAIIAKDFTVENVVRVTEATAKWLRIKHAGNEIKIVVGHDCRFGGQLFAEAVTKVLAHNGIKVLLAKGFVSTPMISLGVVQHNANIGIIITASHNPPAYNGYKLKGNYGGPLIPSAVAQIESMIADEAALNVDQIVLADFESKSLLEYVDLEDAYISHVEKNFDLPAIRNSKMNLAYDAMFGAGQNVMKRLFPNITMMHCDDNPGFHGQAPEPIHKNLLPFSNMIKSTGNIDSGLVTDGDADRIGFYDGKGNFIDSHHIILLLIQYLVKYKGMSGKVIVAFSVSPKVVKLCEYYGLECRVVKIGFKYICEIMINEDVLLGGEESGGIAIKGHIPERDGIWMGLILWEYMAKTGKDIDDLIKEVYDIVGPFSFERSDLHLKEDVKQRIIENTKNDAYKAFGSYKVKRIENTDGYKYFFDSDAKEWLLIRASGTEPVLRTYAESATREGAFKILKEAEKTLLEN